jgi:hypothetical protein
MGTHPWGDGQSQRARAAAYPRGQNRAEGSRPSGGFHVPTARSWPPASRASLAEAGELT